MSATSPWETMQAFAPALGASVPHVGWGAERLNIFLGAMRMVMKAEET